jgi:hypothetical protein
MLGADLAVIDVNQSATILPNHLFERFDYGAGSSVFDYGYAFDRISIINRSEFGYVTVSSDSSAVTMGIMRIFEDLEWTLACVEGSNTSIDLNRTEDWPLYARVAVSSTYLIGSTV